MGWSDPKKGSLTLRWDIKSSSENFIGREAEKKRGRLQDVSKQSMEMESDVTVQADGVCEVSERLEVTKYEYLQRYCDHSCVNGEFRDDTNSSSFEAIKVVPVLMTVCWALITRNVLSGVLLIRGLFCYCSLSEACQSLVLSKKHKCQDRYSRIV